MCEWFLDAGYRKAFTDLPHLIVSRSAFSSWVLQGSVHVCSELLGSSFHSTRISYKVCCYNTGSSDLDTLLHPWWLTEIWKKPKSLVTNNNKNNPPPAQVLFSLGEAINPHHRKQQKKKSYHNQECWNKYSWHTDKNQEKACIPSLKSSIQKSFNAPC